MRVLIAEDDTALAMFLGKGLELEGYVTALASDGFEVIESALSEPPDLLILDLNMPGKDGIQVLTDLQQQGSSIPTLVLTGRGSVSDRVACLDLGADDYLQKPFSLRELLARCRAIRRRRQVTVPTVVTHGDLVLDQLSHTVQRAGIVIELTIKEHALLNHLLQHRGRVVDRAELLAEVFNLSPESLTTVVEVYISYLRTKLRVEPASLPLIETVRGQGYTIRPDNPRETKRPVQPAGVPRDDSERAIGE